MKYSFNDVRVKVAGVELPLVDIAEITIDPPPERIVYDPITRTFKTRLKIVHIDVDAMYRAGMFKWKPRCRFYRAPRRKK